MTTSEHGDVTPETTADTVVPVVSNTRAIDTWEAKFLRLYEEFEAANEEIDSFPLHCILVGFGSDAERARRELRNG